MLVAAQTTMVFFNYNSHVEYKIISSYIGYKTSENINLNENKSIVLYLNPELFEIEEVHYQLNLKIIMLKVQTL